MAQIKTEGFKELSRTLKALGGDFQSKLKNTNFSVANFVKGKAENRARGLGGVAAKAATALRASKTTAYAAIRLGGARYPWALGAEFGSKKYGQFKPWRGTMNDAGRYGYFLGPTIRDNRQQIVTEWQRGVEKILNEANFPQ